MIWICFLYVGRCFRNVIFRRCFCSNVLIQHSIFTIWVCWKGPPPPPTLPPQRCRRAYRDSLRRLLFDRSPSSSVQVVVVRRRPFLRLGRCGECHCDLAPFAPRIGPPPLSLDCPKSRVSYLVRTLGVDPECPKIGVNLVPCCPKGMHLICRCRLPPPLGHSGSTLTALPDG